MSKNLITWVEEVQEMMRVRDLCICNQIKTEPIITENKIIMDYAKKYIKENKVLRDTHDQINYICIHKKLLLLSELVGERGRNVTAAFYNINEKSLLKWKLNFLSVKKLPPAAIKVWNQFKEQIKMKSITITCDFKTYIESRLKILRCEQYYWCKILDN